MNDMTPSLRKRGDDAFAAIISIVGNISFNDSFSETNYSKK